MPVAVIIKTPGWLENTVQFKEARFHIINIGGDIFKFIPELSLVVFACGGAITAVGIEGRIDIDKVDGFSREGFQLDKAVPAMDDAGLHGYHCIMRDIAIVDGIKYN